MTWVDLALTALGSAGLAAVFVKWLNRGVDKATADKIHAEAREIAVRSTSAEIQALRDILEDFRLADARKAQHVEDLEQRIDKLEERERHMLTRAAVHEAWDQLAFQFIAGHDASFPPPPPLRPQPPAIAPAKNEDSDDN